jgi:hypothetical protein
MRNTGSFKGASADSEVGAGFVKGELGGGSSGISSLLSQFKDLKDRPSPNRHARRIADIFQLIDCLLIFHKAFQRNLRFTVFCIKWRDNYNYDLQLKKNAIPVLISIGRRGITLPELRV